MADADEDLFADLYDGEDAEPEAAQPAPAPLPVKTDPEVTAPAAEAPTQDSSMQQPRHDDFDDDVKPFDPSAEDMDGVVKQQYNGNYGNSYDAPSESRQQVRLKDDGKMFIGGLNWETTDQGMKDYFSQFGEVLECTVMRDGVSGRSRGFGFLTFKDPKVVNVVMVKEHLLDGKLIDPKRAIPRDEQEKTSKIFVGGVSQEATEHDFRAFFAQFGNVLDCTLMMDKDTGRPRGFGFVTFDDDAAVEQALAQPLAIHGKPIEVKRAEPRGGMEDGGGGGRGGRGGRFNDRGGRGHGGGFGNHSGGRDQQMQQEAPAGQNGMSPAMMAQYWQRMQQYFQMMQQQMAAGQQQQQGGMGGMQGNPAMMQQMMRQMQGGGGGAGGQQMNPQMMQQMMAMQGQQGQQQQGGFPGAAQGSQSPSNGMRQGSFDANQQMMFEQQKYERQTMARMQGTPGFNPAAGNGSSWDGMYDGEPAPPGNAPLGPSGPRGGARGGRGGGNVGRGGGGSPAPGPGQAPVGAPTGPKNANMPGSNYRGGGRGGGARGRFDPYGRGK
ncbi:hypothetical protein B0A48_03408 [Cryoendolithus antarcticus]|uniref:RRM domain-containing protein n=1 Tax=Cryoendolithus antarcticus TaxID=1507870 RepID=A0A1V8TKA7_9PEZI|nr:hypothetical protein B0A48_03408 [Cryoendolithus antarcticus]